MDKATPCVEYPTVYLHPYLDDSSPVPARHRQEQAMLQKQASSLCAECPLLERCLSDAVLKFDVSGFVAGTTHRQRVKIRKILNVKLQQENFDQIAGLSRTGVNRDPDEIATLRKQYPTYSLRELAEVAGCSVSTVKRHLRQQNSPSNDAAAPVASTPTTEQLLAVASDVCGRRMGERVA